MGTINIVNRDASLRRIYVPAENELGSGAKAGSGNSTFWVCWKVLVVPSTVRIGFGVHVFRSGVGGSSEET